MVRLGNKGKTKNRKREGERGGGRGERKNEIVRRKGGGRCRGGKEEELGQQEAR